MSIQRGADPRVPSLAAAPGGPTAEAAADDAAAGTFAVAGVGVSFVGLKALEDVSLGVADGEILGLIGPNGAGKTTLINVMTGFQPPTSGRVLLDGRDITGRPPRKFARMGIARTFQAGRLFRELSVFENVALAALGTGKRPRDADRIAWQLLDSVGLADRADRLASELPYGDERRLGIVRALATGPRFLLLDEPAAGLNEVETDALLVRVRDIRREYGCGVIVIEHDMRLIMSLCDRVHVLNYGRSLADGTPAEVRTNPEVISAYLGKRSDG